MFGEIVPRGSSSKTSTLLLRAGDPLEAKEEYFGTSSVPAARRPFRRNALRSIMLHPDFPASLSTAALCTNGREPRTSCVQHSSTVCPGSAAARVEGPRSCLQLSDRSRSTPMMRALASQDCPPRQFRLHAPSINRDSRSEEHTSEL